MYCGAVDRGHAGRTFGNSDRDGFDPWKRKRSVGDPRRQSLQQFHRLTFDRFLGDDAHLRVVNGVLEPVRLAWSRQIRFDFDVHPELLRMLALGRADPMAPVERHTLEANPVHEAILAGATSRRPPE